MSTLVDTVVIIALLSIMIATLYKLPRTWSSLNWLHRSNSLFVIAASFLTLVTWEFVWIWLSFGFSAVVWGLGKLKSRRQAVLSK